MNFFFHVKNNTRCPISPLKFKFRIKWRAECGGSTNSLTEFSRYGAFHRNGSYILCGWVLLQQWLHVVNLESIAINARLMTVVVFKRLRIGSKSLRRLALRWINNDMLSKKVTGGRKHQCSARSVCENLTQFIRKRSSALNIYIQIDVTAHFEEW